MFFFSSPCSSVSLPGSESTSQSSLVMILLQFCDEAAWWYSMSSTIRLSGFKSLENLVTLCVSSFHCKIEVMMPIRQHCAVSVYYLWHVKHNAYHRISTQCSCCYCFLFLPFLYSSLFTGHYTASINLNVFKIIFYML